jgi:hypothetical protein
VKNGIKVTGIILISLLYCYATGRLNVNSGNWIPEIDFISNQVFYSQTDAVSKFYHVTQTKTTVNTFNNNLPSPNKNQYNEFYCFNKLKEQFLFNKVTRILFRESGIFLFFPKTDIIFPSHYFW